MRARRASYAEEPDLLARVRALLGVVFPGIPEAMDLAAPLGLRWDRCSTPFVAESAGRILSHVGVMEMRFVLAGTERRVGILHAVATDPAERRRGHYRAVMDEVLPWCEERWRTVVLNTGQPELYEPFGFRWVPEHRFVLPSYAHGGRPAAGASAATRFRPLDYARAEDRERLLALLAERAPVSRRLGVVGETQAFAFNECARPPGWAPDLDVAVCFERAGTTLRIFDVVARRMPTLEEIVARVDGPVERVEYYLTPDVLDDRLVAEPHTLHGDEHLMVRGEFPPEGAGA